MSANTMIAKLISIHDGYELRRATRSGQFWSENVSRVLPMPGLWMGNDTRQIRISSAKAKAIGFSF